MHQIDLLLSREVLDFLQHVTTHLGEGALTEGNPAMRAGHFLEEAAHIIGRVENARDAAHSGHGRITWMHGQSHVGLLRRGHDGFGEIEKT